MSSSLSSSSLSALHFHLSNAGKISNSELCSIKQTNALAQIFIQKSAKFNLCQDIALQFELMQSFATKVVWKWVRVITKSKVVYKKLTTNKNCMMTGEEDIAKDFIYQLVGSKKELWWCSCSCFGWWRRWWGTDASLKYTAVWTRLHASNFNVCFKTTFHIGGSRTFLTTLLVGIAHNMLHGMKRVLESAWGKSKQVPK